MCEATEGSFSGLEAKMAMVGIIRIMDIVMESRLWALLSDCGDYRLSILSVKNSSVSWYKVILSHTSACILTVRGFENIYIYVCVYVCMCVHVYMCMCVCVCLYVYVCMYACVCMYLCMYVCLCMHVCAYVCMYVCMCVYVCMYARMHVCM